ncbi:ABC transporter permease [Streptomyces sp. NPDC059452]|uniref:ABC transporter permease n=1 Tax=Streptomyces sp. NPDC059452 TaxID=3346835 RepID=UPI00369FA4A6
MSTPPNRRAVAVVLLIPLVVTLALWAFAWPAARIAPRDLPVGVAGAAPAADQLRSGFEQRAGAFEVHRFDDEAAAREAIEDRVVYGAVVAGPEGPHVLTASAASPVVAQLLREAVTAAVPEGTEVRVTDVVAAPSGDPRGGALGASILPLALAGMGAGAAVTLLGLRGRRAALTLVAAAGLVGLAATAVAHSWLGVITGDWWTEAGAFALTVLAIGSAVAGLAALLGPRGIGLGALLMVLLGNSFSGVTSAPELLPEPVGAIGQWLPPGAGGSLLRSVAFFEGGGAGGAVLTLALWSVLGLAAVLLARGKAAPEAEAAKPGEAAPEAQGAEPAREPAPTG